MRLSRVAPAMVTGLVCSLAVTATAGAAASPRVVGGTDAPAGKYPTVAHVIINSVLECTGTLIAPQWVLTAGHCGSVTGALEVGTPVAYPPASFRVTLGTINADGSGGDAVTVDDAVIPPAYLNTSGNDITLLHLAAPAKETPTPVAGVGYEALWQPNVLEEIAGFGTTSSGGDDPATMQQAKVPIVTDQSCSAAYSSFEAKTQLCAGFAQGGVDSCQGDSGGPLFSRTADDRLLVVGAVSYGDGCGQPGVPGVYARVADATLREFIRSNAPDGVLDAVAGAVTTPSERYDPATMTVLAGAPAPAAAPAASTPTASRMAFRASLAADATTRRTVGRRGVRVRVRCSAGCTAALALQISAAAQKHLHLATRTVGTTQLTRRTAGRTAVRIRLRASVARRVLGGRYALRLTARVTPAGGQPLRARTKAIALRGAL